MASEISSKIILKGRFQDSGFGFYCLQKALSLKICGSFEYQNTNEVKIVLTGTEDRIAQFYTWCLVQKPSYSGEIFYHTNNIISFNEFQIVNQP